MFLRKTDFVTANTFSATRFAGTSGNCSEEKHNWKKINESLACTAFLQSWAKSVESFALSYPRNAIGTAMTPPLTPPCSGSEMIHPDFSGGEGGESIFSCQCFQEIYLEKRNVITSIFHNILPFTWVHAC